MDVIAPRGPARCWRTSRVSRSLHQHAHSGYCAAASGGGRGQPRLSFHASTSAAPADFTGKLVRVEPSGRAWFVCLGYARSTALFGTDEGPDTVRRWEFSLDATACAFQPGERVRLEITSSAFPLFERHPNTDVPPIDALPSDWRRSTQILWHDAARPATLSLPLAG